MTDEGLAWDVVGYRGGEKIGRLHLVVYDEESGRSEWVAIRKGILWPHTCYAPAGGLARDRFSAGAVARTLADPPWVLQVSPSHVEAMRHRLQDS